MYMLFLPAGKISLPVITCIIMRMFFHFADQLLCQGIAAIIMMMPLRLLHAADQALFIAGIIVLMCLHSARCPALHGNRGQYECIGGDKDDKRRNGAHAPVPNPAKASVL